jgi:hypothetical protein
MRQNKKIYGRLRCYVSSANGRLRALFFQQITFTESVVILLIWQQLLRKLLFPLSSLSLSSFTTHPFHHLFDISSFSIDFASPQIDFYHFPA